MDHKKIEKALAFATKAHESQLRKYTGEPYINHPITVARTVSLCHGATTDMVCAALLHDVVEDCMHYCLMDIVAAFGDEVAALVNSLTKKAEESFPDYNRITSKVYELQRLSFASAAAQTIKVADLMDNTKTILAYDKEFAGTYLMEKQMLFETALVKADPLLLHLAKQQLDAAFIHIDQLRTQHE